MIEMVTKEYIRKRHLVDGWSIRKLSRQCDVSRQTVRKMLGDAQMPTYTLAAPRPKPAMERWIPVIERWLEDDEKPGVPLKQRHTAVRIHERLVEEYPGEFGAAESTVRYWVRRLRNKTPEAFVPLAADAGELAEADFGAITIKINRQPTVVHVFVMRMRYSSVLFAHAFSTEKLEAFLEGHRLAFEWLGGVPGGVRYDNPKTAVTKILAGPAREEHQLLSSLRAHYLFDSDFCRPGKPHEKGGVEHGVGYIRRHTCVPVPDVHDLAEFNAVLMAWCEKRREQDGAQWEPEHAGLRALPKHPHVCAVPHWLTVNKLCLVTFDRNRYSVPSLYVGRTLLVRAYAEKIEVLDKDRVVAAHHRCHGRGRQQPILELEHYLPALERKPHAVTHAAVVRHMPEVYQQIRRRMMDRRPDGYKDFLQILLLHRVFPVQDILEAIEAIGASGVTADQIRTRLLPNAAPTGDAVSVPDELKSFRLAQQSISRYDVLARGLVH